MYPRLFIGKRFAHECRNIREKMSIRVHHLRFVEMNFFYSLVESFVVFMTSFLDSSSVHISVAVFPASAGVFPKTALCFVAPICAIPLWG